MLIKSSKEKDQAQRKVLLNDAFETASFGMRLNQNCWQTHHCYAVALWDLKTTQSLSSLIEAAPIVKVRFGCFWKLRIKVFNFSITWKEASKFIPIQRRTTISEFGTIDFLVFLLTNKSSVLFFSTLFPSQLSKLPWTIFKKPRNWIPVST